MHVIVTSNKTHRVLGLKANLSAALAVTVGNAFTESFDPEAPLHDLLRSMFGEHKYRWFCVDQSDVVYAITFSDAANPRVLEYQGAPASISAPDRATLEIRMQDIDMIRPGRVNVKSAHYIQDVSRS